MEKHFHPFSRVFVAGAVIAAAGLAEGQESQQTGANPPGASQQPAQGPAGGRPRGEPGKFMYGPGGPISDSFSGIGQVGPGIDLLSNPARDRVFETPAPTVTVNPCPMPYPSPMPRRHRHDWGGNGFRREVPVWTGGTVSGSGLTVRGTYSSGNWNIAFNLGSGTPTQIVQRWCGGSQLPPVCTYPLFGWVYPSGVYWGPSRPIGPNTYGADGRLFQPAGTVAPQSTSQPPASADSAQQVPAAPLTYSELSRLAIAQRQPRVAVEAIREQVKMEGETAEALRLLSLALAMDKRWNDASAVMRAAYRIDPMLGRTPMDLVGLGFGASEWRGLVTRAVAGANRGKGASDWLLVAVFMQAEGREDLAAKMAQRAVAAGLEAQVAAGFPSSLAKAP